MFVLQVIGVVIFIYGILSLTQDIFNEFTYRKISHNMKIVVFAKELEKNIEQFVVELYNMKKASGFHEMIAIDLNENDDIEKIKKSFFNNEVNVEVLSKSEGREYIDKNVLL